MDFRTLRFILFSTLLLSVSSSTVVAQGRSDTTIVISDTTNLDALFKRARELAYDNNYVQARRITLKILEKKPNYYDVRTFLGRIYAWEKQYDNARTELSRVLIEKENDFEALSALYDVEFWTESYSVANDYLTVALGYYPTSEALLIKKARLQIKLEEKDDAALTLRRVLDLNPGQKEAISLMNTLEGRSLNNHFTTSFQVDNFDEKDARQQVYAEYGRNLIFGSLTGRVYYADKFNRTGFLYELESYAHFTRTTYVDLLVGYSDATIFPELKYSGEIFQKLTAGFELSAGARYLKFLRPTTIYTASITNYYKDYYFNVRTFITPKKLQNQVESQVTSYTVIVSIRTYFGDSDNYLGIKIGKGSVPDEGKLNDATGVILYYPTTQGGMELQKKAFGRWLLKCDLTYAAESPSFGKYSKRLTSTITLKTVF